MKLATRLLCLACGMLATAGLAAPAQARPSYLGGAYLAGSFPMGDWADVAGFGLAADATNVTYPNPDRPMAVRSSIGLLYNFSRTVEVPEANLAPSSKLDLETKNWSLYVGFGPEFSRKSGEIVPFIFGTAGFETYWTQSELDGTAGGSPYSAQHGDSRISFAWTAGVGIRRHVSPAEAVEISVEYRSGLTHQFVNPNEVTGSGTTVTANRDSHTSDQILLRIGTLFGY